MRRAEIFTACTAIILLVLFGCLYLDPVTGCWATKDNDLAMKFDGSDTYYFPILLGPETGEGRWVMMPPPGGWTRINATHIRVKYMETINFEDVEETVVFDEKDDPVYFEGLESIRYHRVTCG